MPIVVFILIDGLHPEAVMLDRCPNLAAVMARGAGTLRATSVMPSISLPCHMSIFHSVPPARHGVTTNEWSPMARPLPGLVDVAHAAGRHSASIYNWEPLRNLSRSGSLSFSYFRDTAYTADGDRVIAAEAARAIAGDNLDFAFVYFGTVDTAGHVYGWMSDEYLAQAARVDGELGIVLASLPEDSYVLIQADHGGHDRTHGTDSADDMTIPWVIAGPGIRRSQTIDTPVSLLDTAPTLARLLGIAPHPQWEGRCVDEAFDVSRSNVSTRSKMSKPTDYILASSAEADRLRLQARVWQPAAEALLDLIGIQPGWSCIDLGCGAMGILGPLSRRVGLSGRVVGLDVEKPLLAAARAYVEEEGLTNVEILERDANNTGLPRKSFDFVHERFVFPHAASPDAVLHEMLALTRPGGFVAVQEADQSSWNFFPPSPTWPRLKHIIEAAFALRGDINIGQWTYGMLRRAGLEDVTIRAAVLALQNSHPYMRLPIAGVTAMRKRIVEAGLSTDAELDVLLADVERRVNNPETFQITFTLTQVWGRKR